jgi:hypothetical protein
VRSVDASSTTTTVGSGRGCRGAESGRMLTARRASNVSCRHGPATGPLHRESDGRGRRSLWLSATSASQLLTSIRLTNG